jgi:hypothetical protein
MNPFVQALTIALLSASPATAPAGAGVPWSDHAAPFSFQFGNEIDMHQQTRLTPDGGLFGFLYIAFTGTVTKDGERVATHVDCNAMPGCTAGWIVTGAPVGAELLYQEMDDHPVVLVDRTDIPQPGAFSHWHWKGQMPMPESSSDGYLLQLFATDRFCFIHHDAGAATAAKTCRANGGIKIRPGLDTASHLNIVTSFPSQAP